MIYVELSKKQSAVSSQRSDWNAMIYSGCEKNETQGTQRSHREPRSREVYPGYLLEKN
jgi:hypothetical protein